MNRLVDIHKPNDTIKTEVTLCGIKDLMFDRFPGDMKTQLEPHQKFYQQPHTNIIGLPAMNLISFLTGHNTNSAPKRLRDARQFKKICNACLSFVEIEPDFIPLIRDDGPIRFGAFVDDKDELSKSYIHRTTARLDKGIPNAKERPTLSTPWELRFTLVFYPNKEIKLVEIQNLFEEGGRAIGLGTFRGVFGKFQVTKWDSTSIKK